MFDGHLWSDRWHSNADCHPGGIALIVWPIWVEATLRGLLGAFACRGGRFWTFFGGAQCVLFAVSSYGRLTDPVLRSMAVTRGVEVPDAQWLGAIALCLSIFLAGFLASRRRPQAISQTLSNGSPK